jgi:hypothetical protein
VQHGTVNKAVQRMCVTKMQREAHSCVNGSVSVSVPSNMALLDAAWHCNDHII